MLTNEVEEWTEEEIEKQKQGITPNNRKKVIKQETPKTYNLKKFISDLRCPHLKLVREGDYVICIKCGGKWKSKVKSNKGTSK